MDEITHIPDAAHRSPEDEGFLRDRAEELGIEGDLSQMSPERLSELIAEKEGVAGSDVPTEDRSERSVRKGVQPGNMAEVPPELR